MRLRGRQQRGAGALSRNQVSVKLGGTANLFSLPIDPTTAKS